MNVWNWFKAQIRLGICVLKLWFHKGYLLVKKLVWNVRFKALWYTKYLFKFLEEVSLKSAWSMVANSFRTLSLSLLRRVLVVDGGVEVVNRRVLLSVVGENNIGAPKKKYYFLWSY